MACKICNQCDLFTDVTGEPVCSICTVNFIGGLPAIQERIDKVRSALNLKPGEYLKQDRFKEARRILGR